MLRLVWGMKMFTDMEKTLTDDEIKKCIDYSNPLGGTEKERTAHWNLRNAYVEYIDTWNIYKAYPTNANKAIMQEKKAKVRTIMEQYKDDFEDGGAMLAMKAAYIDVESR